MKLIKVLLFSILFLVTVELYSQVNTTIYININSSQVEYYTTLNVSHMSAKIEQNIKNKKLTVYKDAKLKKKLQHNKLSEIITRKKALKIQNPDNLEDPYDLIDSFEFYEEYPKVFIFQNEVVECRDTTTNQSFYLNYQQFKPVLGSRIVRIINFLKSYGVDTFSACTLAPLCKEITLSLGKRLHSEGFEGSIKAYKNDSLIDALTTDEIIQKTTKVEYQQLLINPFDPENPESVKDTVIITPFDIKGVEGNMVIYFNCVKSEEGFETKIDLLAVAPTFRQFMYGVYTNPRPIFLVKADDYLKMLSPEEKDFWQYFYNYIIYNSLSNGEYGESLTNW